jgi:hypothetical protein
MKIQSGEFTINKEIDEGFKRTCFMAFLIVITTTWKFPAKRFLL